MEEQVRPCSALPALAASAQQSYTGAPDLKHAHLRGAVRFNPPRTAGEGEKPAEAHRGGWLALPGSPLRISARSFLECRPAREARA
ncbi:MAG: hypothetical protein QW067_02150 [Thermofilaceae archaeon]